MTMNCISPRETHDRIVRGDRILFVDVRTPREHAEIHTPLATLMPLDVLDPAKLIAEAGSTGATIATLCKSGMRARQAAEKLAAAGAPDVVVVEGGIMSWADEGLPVVRGKKTIGVDRQTRIAAGAIALTGALLGLFVHPGFTWIPAFVGGGLMFAGLTDICPLAIGIALMPWNRSARTAAPVTCCTR